MGLLPDDRMRALHAAALSASLDRTALLAGLSAAFSCAIPTAASASAQLLVDLHHANQTDELEDGTVPLILLLETAAHLAGPRMERRIFDEALTEARAVLAARALLAHARSARPPTPSYRDDATRALGVELQRERARKLALEAVEAPTEAVNQRIVEIRRKLREGGQLREGDTLGRYTLLEILGRGGFAIVWKAFDQQRKAVVAVKVLHSNLAGDTTRRERFFRGAREMAGLDHPAIVKVLAPSGEDEGFHFFVMELIDGVDLRRAVEQGRVAPEQALPIVLAVGDGLALAHHKGLIHRDVKPANILLGPANAPKLADFDLVGGGDTTGGTRTGALGTFMYTAPECLERPQDADARADVFGLAMTAVFLLHGAALPSKAFRNAEVFVEGLGCSSALKLVLQRALEWEPADRFANAGVLCAELRMAGDLERVATVPARAVGTVPTRSAVVARSEAPVLPEPWVDQGRDALGRWASFAVDGVRQRMRWIPAGSFWMGSPDSENGRAMNEGPRHEVELTAGYWLGESPCTQALWQAVMGDNPSRFKSPDRPVERVSWEDCQAFLAKLHQRVPGLCARLPTEAEWERACRAGTTAATWVGDLVLRGRNDAPQLEAIAWYGGNSGVDFELADGEDSSGWPEKQASHTRAGSHRVGQKRANPFGLHDMLGNVWEWCEDWYGEYPPTKVTDPRGPAAGSYRVGRGGSWSNVARDVRVAYRRARAPVLRDDYLGFRLARGQGPSPGPGAEPHGEPRSGA